MNKGMIISYFDKVSKTRYVSTSITQLAVKLGVHRNTIANWLKENGYFEDDARLVFSIDRRQFIHRLREKKSPGNPIDAINKMRDYKCEFIEPARAIEQQHPRKSLFDYVLEGK